METNSVQKSNNEQNEGLEEDPPPAYTPPPSHSYPRPISLNLAQHFALTQMSSGRNIFLSGSGGVGKSFVIKHFLDSNPRESIGLTSTTGVSALLIKGATLHSYLGIGLGQGTVESLVKMIMVRQVKREKWRKIRTLIIDEISMLSGELFEKLNEIGKIVRRCQKPFGGLQLIVVGDMLQLPPIKATFCFETNAWEECDFVNCLLTENMRQSDTVFRECLEKIRHGNVDDQVRDVLTARIGLDYSEDIGGKGVKPTYMYPVNAMVDAKNTKEFSKLILDNDSPIFSYEMEVKIINPAVKSRVENYQKNLIVQDKIILTKGAQVMLLYNLAIEEELVNGSMGIVEEVLDNAVRVRFRLGTYLIEPFTWEIEEDEKVVLEFTQIPLKLAWSVSIHKTQGATIDCIRVNLKRVFECGQVYVALSRVKSLEGLFIDDIDFDAIMAHPKAVKFYDSLK